MRPDNDARAILAVFRHLALTHNDVVVPTKGRSMPIECVVAYCTCEWAGPDALVDTPWGLFLVTTTPDGFTVQS